MKEYTVTHTVTTKFHYWVDAENEQDAIAKASKDIYDEDGECDVSLGDEELMAAGYETTQDTLSVEEGYR